MWFEGCFCCVCLLFFIYEKKREIILIIGMCCNFVMNCYLELVIDGFKRLLYVKDFESLNDIGCIFSYVQLLSYFIDLLIYLSSDVFGYIIILKKYKLLSLLSRFNLL